MKNHEPVPEHIKVKLKTRYEAQAEIEVDRCAGSHVHFRINDGQSGNIDPFLYEHFVGDKTVLLTPEEARLIGQKLLDFADHVDKYPDIRTRRVNRMKRIHKQPIGVLNVWYHNRKIGDRGLLGWNSTIPP